MDEKHERNDYMVNIPLNSDSTSEGEHNFIFGSTEHESHEFHSMISQNDQDNPEEVQEKARLIDEVLKLQTTLEDLQQRVDSVKEENLKLKSENEVLGTYIDKLMSTSSVFHQTGSKPKSKK